MSNETISTTAQILYDVRGVDQSIRSSQRLLYSLNAIRLVVADFKRFSEDPNIVNLLWTGVQLTRVWTSLHRMVKATNKAQAAGMAAGLGGVGVKAAGAATGSFLGLPAGAFGLGASASTAAAASAAGGGGVGAFIGLLGATLGALVFLNPITAIATLAVVGTSAMGYRQYFIDKKNRIDREEWLRTQRETWKSMGYDF